MKHSGSGSGASVSEVQGFHSLDVANRLTGIVVSASNSSTTPLGASAEFTGTGELITKYQEITINLAGGPSNATGTLFFEFSPDNTNWDVSVPVSLANPNSFVPQPLRVVLPYFRVRYVNGSVAQTSFRLTTVFHYYSAKMLTRFLNQVIDENEPVENVRAMVMGQQPDGDFENSRLSGSEAGNTSTATLGANATFTGIPFDTTGFTSVSLIINASHASAANGVKIQFSNNGFSTINRERVFNYGATDAGNGRFYGVDARQGEQFRVVYTNGPTAQTSFDLRCELGVDNIQSELEPIENVITNTSIAVLTRAIIAGMKEDGTYGNVGVSDTGSLKVAVTDRPSEVRDRTRIEIVDTRRSLVGGAGNTIYTVTSGKILYITSATITFINDANAIGEWYIRDNTTIRVPFVATNKAVGAAAAAAAPSPSLPEPWKFETNVNLFEVTGDMITAITLIGYEE